MGGKGRKGAEGGGSYFRVAGAEEIEGVGRSYYRVGGGRKRGWGHGAGGESTNTKAHRCYY